MTHTIRDEFRAMNTDIEVTLLCEQPSMAEPTRMIIREWFHSIEQRFSRFNDDSELSKLNGAHGLPVAVSSVMLEVLGHAMEYRRLTHGIYNPCILNALERSGYSASFEHIGETADRLNSTSGTIHRAPTGVSTDTVRQRWKTYPLLRLARLTRGTRIDLGGVVKGWAVDRIAAMLRSSGCSSGHVNAGGDLRVWGWGQDDLPNWQIDIDSPWSSDEENGKAILASAIIGNGSAATSGTTRRRWTSSSGTMHHLIDPRTDMPANSDVLQCTVVGASAVDAEIVAKTICILGSADGETWVKQAFPEYDVCVALNNRTTTIWRGRGSSVRWEEKRS
ncbi:FAD:protein FMN transferase [Cohnella soli]|uniref:FAD:protein FMN transferase n=1 Tax=Cohnella soli TaxID=425005 RepID=A0ABW0I478_9BACL